MPPRPVLKPKQGRPISAVYIGKSTPKTQSPSQSPKLPSSYSFGTPPGLPDLPEPPSPSSSVGSVKSGLPSPPATNSTGSGSTGDPATIAIRNRPLSLHSNSSTSTSSGSHPALATPVKRSSNAPSSRSSSRQGDHSMEDTGADGDFDDDYDRENDNDNESNMDGDDTARLDRKLLAASNVDKPKGANENQVALQRAKSLAERNRLAISKLSRLGSPLPARSGTPNSRSPAPSHAGSSRSQSVRQPRPLPQMPQQKHEHVRNISGSETERESTHPSQSTQSHSSHSSSSQSRFSSMQRSVSYSANTDRPTTPPAAARPPNTSPNVSPYNRLRHISAPASPQKARLIAASTSSGSNQSQSPSNRRRNRASMASVDLTDFEEEDDGQDDSALRTATGTARGDRRDRTLSEHDMITQSALAAVASARRSPVGNRRRSALPKEFRSDLVVDDSPPNGRKSAAGERFDTRRGSIEDDRRESWKSGADPVTPFRGASALGRSSTVRERRSSGNPRWSSDDYRTSATVRDLGYNPSHSNEDGGSMRRERKQSLRGGSVESALGVLSPGGRTLIGEGLRAAGLTRRRDDEPRSGARSAGLSNGDVFLGRERKVDWSPQDVIDDGRTRAMVDRERDRGGPPRASTSMAHYQYLDRDSPEDRQRERVLRGHRSTYSLVSRELESFPDDRSTSAMGRYATLSANPPTPRLAISHLQDRLAPDRVATASPFGSRRYSALPPVTPQTEHARLMLDSLTMFETALSKMPRSNVAVGTGSTHADLLQNSQGMVHAADRLYNLLKQGSARAVDAQVEVEVESSSRDPHPKELVDLWGKVAADYREGSRTADDLIRGITGLLLGMGRVMRELTADRGTSETGSPSVHGRHASLDDDVVRRRSPEVGLRVNNGGSQPESSSGRQSVASRHSWDPPRDNRERDREDALRRLAGVESNEMRADSVLARASPATFQRLKDRENQQQYDSPSPLMNSRNALPQTGGPTGSVRRLFTPREQREQAQQASEKKPNATLRAATLAVHDSPASLQPSPTPAARTRNSPAVDRPRPLPPLNIPKPLPTLPSESLLRDNREPASSVRRKNTLRNNDRPTFPSITSPANPTIALTPHTVSNGERFPMTRMDSDKSGRVQVTFSRPNGSNVSKNLSQLQQADGERKRTISTTSMNAEPADPNSTGPIVRQASQSSSDAEKDARRRTASRYTRMSLDSQRDEIEETGTSRVSTAHAADRSAASTVLPTAGKRERRRTVTDIWPR